ncbi:MAG: hypothetical protein KF762_07015 [Acidobacteria bacterium]|nr:hypothetical protein [Acidobacteriota bacterium]
MKCRGVLFAILFLTFPLYCFGQSPDLKVLLSIRDQTISKAEGNVIEVKVCIDNVGKQPVLIVVDEPIRLLYNVKKKELGLGLERDYGKYNYQVPRLEFLERNERLVVKRIVPTTLFAKISEGKWHLDSTIGYILEDDFEKLGITPEISRKRGAKEKYKIYSIFDPSTFAEIQHLEISNGIEIDVINR